MKYLYVTTADGYGRDGCRWFFSYISVVLSVILCCDQILLILLTIIIFVIESVLGLYTMIH